MSTALIVFIVLLVIGSILFVDCIACGPLSSFFQGDEFVEMIAGGVMGIACVGLIVCLIFHLADVVHEREAQQLAVAQRDGWEFYIDGEKSPYTDIDNDLYRVTFDAAQHKVIMEARR